MKSITKEGINYFQLNVNKKGQIFCPFCEKTHIHGKGDGHRQAHCSLEETREEVFFENKSHLRENGYFIKY